MQKKEAVANTVIKNYQSPVMKIKFSNLANPFYYPTTPNIPRYSITCVLDPDKHREFLKMIRQIEEKDNIVSTIKDETSKDRQSGDIHTTGKYLIKFNGKDKIPVSFVRGDKALPPDSVFEEPKYGTECSVIFDIVRYNKKGTNDKGLSFQPSLVYIHETQQAKEDTNLFSAPAEESPF